MCVPVQFIQCLANPFFCSSLAQRGLFDDDAFVKSVLRQVPSRVDLHKARNSTCSYLEYLLYFKRPEYARLLIYPQALSVLELLQNADFRAKLAHEGIAGEVASRMIGYWGTWRTGGKSVTSPEAKDAIGTGESVENAMATSPS